MAKPRVLIVEDEPHIVLALEFLLGRAGYETVSAADGETGLDLARRVKQFTESQSELRLVPYDQAYAKGFEDMRRRVPSTDKIYQLTGWKPARSLDEIIRLTVESQRAAAS